MNRIARLLTLVPPASPRPPGASGGIVLRDAFAHGADDAFVNAAVKNSLRQHAGLERAGIHVSTSRGVVQLSGFVASRRVIADAVGAARRVPGVRSVRNDMRLA